MLVHIFPGFLCLSRRPSFDPANNPPVATIIYVNVSRKAGWGRKAATRHQKPKHTKSPCQNRKWARCFPAGSWQGATKEHSQSSVTEEQRRQVSARKQPSGLPIFAAAAALLVGRRSIKDILSPRALQHHQFSGNASVPYFDLGSKSPPLRLAVAGGYVGRHLGRCGGIGRRARLKIWYSRECVGSTPSIGTTVINNCQKAVVRSAAVGFGQGRRPTRRDRGTKMWLRE